MLTSQALIACGYQVGTYLSPHLLKYNERFLCNGQEISDKDFASYFSRVYRQALKVKGITEFEILTGLMFLYFAEKNIDVAVLETGLGGRYDATNVCRAILSIIAPIAYDHQDILGNTLAKIAAEKAGIIKKNVPVVSAAQEPEVLAEIVSTVEKLETTLNLVGQPLKFELPLLGEHQRYNAALVIAALQELKRYKIYIPRRLMLNGLAQTRVPGRLEVIAEKPLTILDVGHNPQAFATMLVAVGKKYPFHKKVLIFGLLKRKNLTKILDVLKDNIAEILTVTLPAPDSYSAAELALAAKKFGFNKVQSIGELKKAYLLAKKNAGKKDLIIVAGSFYLVGWFYKLFRGGKIY
jgi:dihydrofolate synthase/folylpolyglutamate synthase